MSTPPETVQPKTEECEIIGIGVECKKDNLLCVEGQNFKKVLCDIPWYFNVTNCFIKEGLRMHITCGGSHLVTGAWKQTVTRLNIKFYDGNYRPKVDPSRPELIRHFEITSLDKTVDVALSFKDLEFLVPSWKGWHRVYLKAYVTVERDENESRNHGRPMHDFRRRIENSTMMIRSGWARFFVNLEYLAEVSEYFSVLCRNTQMMQKDSETGLWLQTFQDIDPGEFEELLQQLHPIKKPVPICQNNVLAVAKLADRFQCGFLMRRCAESMIGMKHISASYLVWICEKYNMEWNVVKILICLRKWQLRTMRFESKYKLISPRAVEIAQFYAIDEDSD